MSKILVGIVSIGAVMAAGTIMYAVHRGKDRRAVHEHRDRTGEVSRHHRTAAAANVLGRLAAFVTTD